MTIAAGEKRSPMNPSGPCRETKPKTSNPTTTVGSESRVLNRVMIARLPGNGTVPMAKPKGTAVRVPSSVAVAEIQRERKVIEKTSRSRERINANALESPSKMKPIMHVNPERDVVFGKNAESVCIIYY
jgi:hypothetical protein